MEVRAGVRIIPGRERRANSGRPIHSALQLPPGGASRCLALRFGNQCLPSNGVEMIDDVFETPKFGRGVCVRSIVRQ